MAELVEELDVLEDEGAAGPEGGRVGPVADGHPGLSAGQFILGLFLKGGELVGFDGRQGVEGGGGGNSLIEKFVKQMYNTDSF